MAGGIVNAIAGGGSLLTFPALVASGVPSVVASLTNTVAMCPGYVGGTWAQRRDLAGQRKRALAILPGAALGGVAGALLLLHTGEAAFDVIVPFLLLFAAVLLGLQPKLRSWLAGKHAGGAVFATIAVALAAVYGGYFGAGLGVIVLAALAVVFDDNLVRLNALKQSISLAVNVAAAIVFLWSGRVDWLAALVMAIGSLAGGVVGGTLASRIPAGVLRVAVVVIALAVAAYYFAKLL